jgi:hypothetical protein
VLSLNLNRRHLDESQRGMVAARLANLALVVIGGRKISTGQLAA